VNPPNGRAAKLTTSLPEQQYLLTQAARLNAGNEQPR
jgi:hypothetical protein